MLAGYLHDYRLTLELKSADLGPEAMACRSVEPSDLSLLGLVRYLFRCRAVLVPTGDGRRRSPPCPLPGGRRR